MRRISFLSSPSPEAQDLKAQFESLYPSVPVKNAEVIIALGGDGFMLETMHTYLHAHISLYGIHCGSIGFLMNECSPKDLLNHLQHANPTSLYPLEMEAHQDDGSVVKALAFNEVSLLRETHQAAKVLVSIDGVVRLPELMCDGILLATPAGSTAYNLSAHGPIIPLGAPLLALTPISAFRPRRWKGALLPDSANVTFEILEPEKRPVKAVADFTEVRHIRSVIVRQVKNHFITLLFDPNHNLGERILREQFIG